MIVVFSCVMTYLTIMSNVGHNKLFVLLKLKLSSVKTFLIFVLCVSNIIDYSGR